jgi:hypothetical protein
MFLIPGFLIAILTFPGIIIHEAAHRLFCDICGVPVYQVCYFRVGDPSGYVIHGRTDRLRANFLIAMGPLLVNSVLCAVISFSAIIAFAIGTPETPVIFIILLWLGISIGMHAFPSAQDVKNFSEAVRAAGHGGFLYAIAKAIEYVFRFVNVLRIVWFDLVYAVAIASVLPLLAYAMAG